VEERQFMAKQTVTHLLQLVRNGDIEIGVAWSTGAFWQPRADVSQTADAVLVQVEAPGLDEENLRLRFEPGQLIIEGVRPRPGCDPPHRCLQVEIEYGPFRRVLPLPPDIDAEGIQARYHAGILSIRVPRRKPTPATPTRIAVV
jgi:HSP20 family protein